MSAPIGRATLWDVAIGRRKRDSKRRWKARARLGKPIPRQAFEEHSLNRWFVFRSENINRDYGIAVLAHCGSGWYDE